MELIKYIYDAIKPINDTEYTESIMFNQDMYSKLAQDGIYICKAIPTDNETLTDFIHIGEYYIIRKNNPREIAWLNSSGSFEWELTTSKSIYRRLLPPPIETVNHTKIIQCLHNQLLTQTNNLGYLEFGIRSGHNFKSIAELNTNGTNIGVDLDLSLIDPNVLSSLEQLTSSYSLYEMKTQDYTPEPTMKFHLAFIDADHCSTSAFNDFERILPWIHNGGYIVLHDTYPCSPEYLNKGGSYDCYKVPGMIKEKYLKNKLIRSIITLPLNPGVSIIQV
jgi:hypothetical protein